VDKLKILYKFGFYLNMNKTLFLLFVFPFFFSSCIEEKKGTAFETLGKLNSVSVIIDDQLWNGEVGDSIRNKFASPVIGLQDEEPLFTLNQYPVKLLDGYLSKSRNIIIFKKDVKNAFTIKQNEGSPQQIIVQFSGRTVKDLVDSIEVKTPFISKTIRDSEIKVFQSQIYTSTKDKNDINEGFAIDIKVPVKYKTVLKGKKFLWLKKEINGGSLSLIAYQVPFKRLKDTTNIINSIVKLRDSIGNIYIHGSRKKARMLTESDFTPYIEKTVISNATTYETKGTWNLKNDFMSGPFVNYAIIDEKHKRVLVVEGFCYAPFKGKRDFMLELEAIIKTIKL
jgi:hypothetical protein